MLAEWHRMRLLLVLDVLVELLVRIGVVYHLSSA